MRKAGSPEPMAFGRGQCSWTSNSMAADRRSSLASRCSTEISALPASSEDDAPRRSTVAAAWQPRVKTVAGTAGMRVIYVVVGFCPGYPEVSDRNATFNRLKASGAFAAGAENAKIHPAVTPLEDEIVVTKHRVSAFAGTDLDLILRANGIETLILTGIITSGVVLSTLRHAADADYGLLVVGDCCSDRDEETHRVLLEKVFPWQATITTAEEFEQAIGARR
jgi:nicotinamidase-related amidase